MERKLTCVADNRIQKWMKNGLLHREDGPAIIRGSGKNRVEEYWVECCLVSAAMLELHKTLTPEVDGLVRARRVVKLDAYRR